MPDPSSTPTTLVTRIRLAQRCWIDAAVADDLAQRCLAVLATCADDTVVSSVTAARLHGLWLPDLADEIHVATATPGRAGRSMTRNHRREFVAHRFQLRPEDVVHQNGVVLTSVARTWRDLARVLRLPDLVAAGDSALRGGVSREELWAVIEQLPPNRRPRRAVLAWPMLDERARSRPESHLRVAVTAPDLPQFQVNTAVQRDEGGWLAEPDLSLSAAKLALEYQGSYHAEVKRMRKDISRTLDMRRAGWTVFEYGPVEVLSRPAEVQADVRAYLRRTAPHLLGRRSRATPPV